MSPYVLDEPSVGLHVVERKAVSELLQRFIDAGNSVLLVEHDMSLVAGCDWIVDIGPRAGERGGQLVFSGPTDEFRAHSQPTPGESAVTAKNIIVDANGNELREAPGFLTYLYRVVLYSIIFGMLLTLRGFIQKALPEKQKPAEPDAAALEATRPVRKMPATTETGIQPNTAQPTAAQPNDTQPSGS